MVYTPHHPITPSPLNFQTFNPTTTDTPYTSTPPPTTPPPSPPHPTTHIRSTIFPQRSHPLALLARECHHPLLLTPPSHHLPTCRYSHSRHIRRQFSRYRSHTTTPTGMYSTLSMGMRLATAMASSTSNFDIYTGFPPPTPPAAPCVHGGVLQGRVEGRAGPLEAFRSFSDVIQHPHP